MRKLKKLEESRHKNYTIEQLKMEMEIDDDMV